MRDPQSMAQAFRENRRHLHSLQDLPVQSLPRNREEGYQVQDALIALYLDAGEGPIAGWKIALTNPAMQDAFGVGEPAEGAIFAPLVRPGSATVSAADYRHLGAEGEIVLRLGTALDASKAPFDGTTVAAAVASVAPGIEIVDDRDAGTSATLGMLVGDNAMNQGCVLGPETPYTPDMDLTALGGQLSVNDRPAGEGTGANVAGGPLNVLAWLANSLVSRGRRLEAGDLVMTGSLALTCWPVAGDLVRWEIEGLGVTSMRIR